MTKQKNGDLPILILPIKQIKLNPNNPRVVKDDKFAKLVQSIKEFPKMLHIRPIVVNDDMIVLGGNMRLRAVKEAGLTEVPVIKASDLSEKEQREFIIKDNVGYGDWDWDMLANEWDKEELDEWGLDTIRQDWDKLDYIEEAEKPEFRKDNVITIIVPDELMGEMREIELELKEYLSKKYSGCEVK